MGAVAVLHPEHRLFFPTTIKMRSRRFNPNPSQTPNLAVTGSRRRPPPKRIHKNTDSSAAMASKNLVMGQVKILKRGEDLNESLTILKEVSNREFSNDSTSTSEASKAQVGSRRRVLLKKVEAVSSPKVEAAKLKPKPEPEDVMYRLGPDSEIVSKQIRECFAGSAFSDSPPPSCVPLPGFFRNNYGKDEVEDATSDLRRILGLNLC